MPRQYTLAGPDELGRTIGSRAGATHRIDDNGGLSRLSENARRQMLQDIQSLQ
jgi:hypothetical protein